MEEEVEWERELADNIQRFCAKGANATAIIVDGTVVRKHNGLVLISGNYNGMNGSTSTEIYDYANKSIRKGPDMKVARFCHVSVTLPTGDVVVFGGFNRNMNPNELSSCEVFNVKSSSFSEIGNMTEKRNKAAAVLLPTGVVLFIGGAEGHKVLKSCEFFNPADNTFSPSKAEMCVGRYRHTASLLPNGNIIVCGGGDGRALKTTEIYDPSTDSFSAGPLMNVKRCYHTATTLTNGRILITGGENDVSSNSTEIYDHATNSFTVGPPMLVTRVSHFAALLPDGSVFIGGGWRSESNQTTEIYDPTTNSFTKGLNLLEVRDCVSASAF